MNATSVTVPSPFYRVTAKAIILDARKRLLVIQNIDKSWELPGGGWEHDESFEACMKREVQEELGVAVNTIGPVALCYRGLNEKGFYALRLAAPVTLTSTNFKLGEDMIAVQFISEQDLLTLALTQDEAPIKEKTSHIWPPARRA